MNLIDKYIQIKTEGGLCFAKVKAIRIDKPSFGYIDLFCYWVTDTNNTAHNNTWVLVEEKSIIIIPNPAIASKD